MPMLLAAFTRLSARALEAIQFPVIITPLTLAFFLAHNMHALLTMGRDRFVLVRLTGRVASSSDERMDWALMLISK